MANNWVPEDTNEIKAIFHVHVPKDIGKAGDIVVLGDVEELGSWQNPIVKLRQPSQSQNPTYWRSEPVAISLLNFANKGEIQYKYAIHIVKPVGWFSKTEEFAFEGDNYMKNRILDITRYDQFDIWENNYNIDGGFRSDSDIHDFAFVEYIYNTIKNDNLKGKVIEYQDLLALHRSNTIRTSGLNFIILHIVDKSREKLLFLCFLLGNFIRRELFYELPSRSSQFPSKLLLDALEGYKQETLPSDARDQMYTAIITLVRHNAFQMQFDWLIIFAIADEVDPNYNFIDRLRTLKYSDDDSLAKFVKKAEIIRNYIGSIKSKSYVKLAEWLIQLCHNMDSLFKLWNNVLLHNHEFDKNVSKCLIDRVRMNISHCDAVTLEHQFKGLQKDYRDAVSEAFRYHALFLLENPNRKWTNENIAAIKKLFRDDGMGWRGKKIIELLDHVSRSHNLELLNRFPELLNGWFNSSDYSDIEERSLPIICITWSENLLKFNLDTSNKISSDETDEKDFIFSIFQQLELLYPLVGHKNDIWRDLTDIAVKKVKLYSDAQIFGSTKLISKIERERIKKLFLCIVDEILNKTVQQINDQLLNIIFIICDCNNNKILEIPNTMSEEALIHIMNILQMQSAASSSSPLDLHLKTLKSNHFWGIILRSTGSVAKLNSNSFVKYVKNSINEFAELLIEKKIDIQFLQQILKYSDEELLQHFDSAVTKMKLSDQVIISRDDISELRNIYNNYQVRLDILFKFYDGFCSTTQITDVNDYIQDIKRRKTTLDKITVKQALMSDHWMPHEEVLESAKICLRFNQSQTFRNVFDSCIQEDVAATDVKYIAQISIPAVFEKYNFMKQHKDWTKLKCSDIYLLLKNVTDFNAELDLMGINRNEELVQILDHLSKIPLWIERLEQLEQVLGIFKSSHDEVWLSKSIGILKDGSIKLGKLNEVFDLLHSKNLPIRDHDFWDVIRELSIADKLMDFLEKISEYDFNGYDINGADDYSDEILIREDIISSLFQVKEFLFSLVDKETVSDFLDSLLTNLEDNRTLSEKMTLCNSNNIILQDMHINISNRREAAMEEIKNFILNGTFTVTNDEKENEYLVKSSPKQVVKYNMNGILYLRRRTLLIAERTSMVMKTNEDNKIINKNADVSKNSMDEFISRVDILQEIINLVSMLLKAGHLDYRKFEKKLQGMNSMKEYRKSLIRDLDKWQETVDDAHKRCYYLTFFSAQHVLSFYDYFTSERLDERNEEECKTLIKFVSSEARLPSHKDVQGTLYGSKKSKNHSEILCEIGNELKKIYRNISKQPRKLKSIRHSTGSDIITKSKLFVTACADKAQVPNVIISLFANYGYYPEPWQILICTTSTTMEEFTIFIRRCFFASSNGYENHLFCIANLELLDFELQYNFVNYVKAMQSEYENKNYLLAILCCKKSGMYNYILDQFSSEVHEIDDLDTEAMQEIYQELYPNVICVSSDLSGQGKTEWIKESSYSKEKIPYTFLISDGMDFTCLVKRLREFNLKQIQSLHINILSTDYPEDVNLFLFELLTFKIVLCDEVVASIPDVLIFIEIASSIKHSHFPMLKYLNHNHLSWNIKNFKVSREITSQIQVVCHFLRLYDRKKVDTEEIFFPTQNFIEDPISEEFCQYFITKYFLDEGEIEISSIKYIEIFVNILADQLVRFSSSQYFTELKLEETDIKSTIIKSLIDISRDILVRAIKTKSLQIKPYENDDFGSDKLNHILLFFNSQNPNSFSTLYHDENQVPDNIKSLLKSQAVGNSENWNLDDYNTIPANELLMKLEVMARTSSEKLDFPEYALSMDNLIKMALILLRVRANIPVVICGEAGCGKTSLITYLAMIVEVQFQVLNLHAGINESDITMFMNDALKKAEDDEIWVFFDEINTCNHLGLLADLMSNGMFQEKPIHPNVRFFATYNPYRLRSRAQYEADLTTKINEYEEQSNLTYQVNPLPDQILDYAWYCNIPKPDDELKYIQIMVRKELKGLADPIFVELLFASQQFIRKVEKPYSVSLRDIKRSITLVKFFYNSLENRPAHKSGHKYPPDGNPTIRIRSYVLALSLCYHSRLCEQSLRKQYYDEMEQIMQNHEACIGDHTFSKIVLDEQEDYINRMRCPSNIVKNEALLENVLVMIACILTRIPLFLIGPSGSSKSLAIRLISSNLRGLDSDDMYFRKLPHVYLVTYQCTALSTSDSIIKIFDKAIKYKEATPKETPKIPVVLLDNVELAETSPFNPLKVLRTLLEPNHPVTGPTVSVIGISNRRLDIGKTSRALLVQRPQFDLSDLLNIKDLDPSRKDAFISLAKSYLVYKKCGHTLPNIHGLRDYYALVNRLLSGEMLSENITTALSRNFGGINFEIYFKDILNNGDQWIYKPISVKRLIYSNLDDSRARHLMVIGKSGSIVNSLTYQLRVQNLDPVVISGSLFPDDQDQYVYSILDKIVTCIETERILILTDLEIIYGCLYNLWDQNCIMTENKNDIKCFTRIAFGTYANPMLYVPPSFKCIVVMDEKNLHSTDPSLLDRFEKQRMSINDILDDKQKILVENLSDWASRMSTLTTESASSKVRNAFSQKDLFVGFDEDETLQSLVINVTRYNSEAEDDEILERCKECLMAMASSDGIVRAEISTLECDEVDRWKRFYFDQKHNCLHDYIVSLINQEKSLTDSEGQLVIVNTFSSINVDIKRCLKDSSKHQVYNLSSFKTESQLSDQVKSFYFESTDQVLIIQCDITAVNAKCINLTKFIIEKFRNEYLAKKETSIKHTCIILHIQRNYESNIISSNFTFDWKYIIIESLEPQKILLINLLNKSLYEIINSELFEKIVGSTTPFEKILKDELLWCFSCIEYQSNENDETVKNHISMLSKEILNNLDFIQCIKEKTFEWVSENCENWRHEVTLDKEYLSNFTCFSLALQNQVKIIIKKTVARILYSLEKLSATTTFFSNRNKESEKKQELFDLWKQYFMSNTVIDINRLCEPKLSAYKIPSYTVINDLKFPFSYYFVNQVNYYKDCYYEELDILSQDSELNEEDHIGDFKNSLISTNPNFENLQKHSKLYYDDFIKIILSTYAGKLTSNELDFVLRYLIGDKIVNDPFILHIYWWKYAESILIQLKLVEAIPNIITKTKNNTALYGKLDLYLFSELINLILQNICDDKPWEESMNKNLSVSDKINDSKSISDLHLLLLCCDLLKINSIPPNKVKEIIQSAKSAKKQEFITVDIINSVFVSLDNNEDIIPIRSFIERSLKLISLESEVRLVLYKNLFSRNPFELASSVIEKILLTEYQQDEQIFFAFIKNSEETLQPSSRLRAINDKIRSIDSNMAVLCCEIIQKIFNRFELNELSTYFKHSIETCMKQQQKFILQQITSIAFIKEFLYKFRNDYFQESNSLSSKEINDVMEVDHSFIQFLQSYFECFLNQQNLFDNEILKKEFPWLGNFTDAEMNHFPEIWRQMRRVNFEDFHNFYNHDLTHNLDKYPFLSVFFKNCERLTLVKHLYPIIRFVKILSLKLEYQLTRKAAYTMTFHEFIKKDEEEYNNLKSLFDEFAFGWNSVINYIIQYQSEELPNKPIMNLDLPVVFGLIEQKDAGIYICAILDFLIGLHNEFLDSVLSIPIEKCESLKFLGNASYNYQTSERCFIASKKVVHASDINFINYEWNDKISKYSQRNPKTTEDVDFIFDLQKIEMKLAKKLVLNKVYFEMEDNQFYLKNFPFKHELFYNSPRILFDIRKILPQELIPDDKMKTALAMFQLSSSSLILPDSVNLPELFFLFEIILCFIKELSIKNNKIDISDFVNKWLKLERYKIASIDRLSEFYLSHVVEFYELIEQKVASEKIHDIDDKFKETLTQEMKDSISNVIDYYNSEDQNKRLISAKEFALALKRFIYRFLLVDSDIENENLSEYFLDFTLGLWTEGTKEEAIKKLFPTCLKVSHAYNSYIFVGEIEKVTSEKQKNFPSTSSPTVRKTRIKPSKYY